MCLPKRLFGKLKIEENESSSSRNKQQQKQLTAGGVSGDSRRTEGCVASKTMCLLVISWWSLRGCRLVFELSAAGVQRCAAMQALPTKHTTTKKLKPQFPGDLSMSMWRWRQKGSADFFTGPSGAMRARTGGHGTSGHKASALT